MYSSLLRYFYSAGFFPVCQDIKTHILSPFLNPEVPSHLSEWCVALQHLPCFQNHVKINPLRFTGLVPLQQEQNETRIFIMKQQQDKYDILKTYYGYDTFRDGQEELIDCLLNGQDVCGIMPTGAGKSVCYQVPALLLPHVTLVVSPLISLMKDQVRALNQMGVHAAYLNSSLSWNQYKKALAYAKEGRYKIIYVAPERLLTEDFLDFAASTPISLLAVDEAHCVSQWGQDFRPSYLKIPEFVRTLPIRPVIGAFTATATREVREDIIRMLELSDPHVAVTGFDRKNLYFEVRHDKDKYRSIRDYLLAHPDSSGVIYCATRKNVEEVCDRLLADGFRATRYHAGLSDEERRANQEAFTYDDAPIMVATNAFGMGIDKSNVRFVLHYNMPKIWKAIIRRPGAPDGTVQRPIVFYFTAVRMLSQTSFLSNRIVITKS